MTTTDTIDIPSTKEPAGDHAPFDFSPWHDLPLPDGTTFQHQREPYHPTILGRTLALVLLILASPLMAITALAVKLESPRASVFYRQERVGLDRRRRGNLETAGLTQDRRESPAEGKSFMIWKFRTMIPDAEAKSGPVWASEDDPRITRLGKFLRRSRLDEVPQLINVLQGNMRLIGPRPERPHFVTQLVSRMPDYRKRLGVPPGITGLAQVNREYDASVDDVQTKLGYDLLYVDRRSRKLDLKILIKTIEVVVRGRGAR